MSSGGGSQPSQTSQTVTQTAELPEWAKPYAKETLAKTEALTSEPYQTYGGERIAGFTPAQTQTQQNIMNMGIAPQMGMASGVTGAGGLASLGAGAQYGAMATTPGAMQAYMSPYMQGVVDVQQREAMRQADIARTQQMGQATRAGAFGGSRQAIVEAERQRNLGQQLGDIQARGLQSAYDQARQAQQFQAELGLRGAGQAAQAGQVLGQLGATQFGQEKDILQAQLGVGEQQRAMQQAGLDLAYQDFLNQQKYPYQQLGFMADMIRGVPVGQTAQTIYQTPSPDPFSQMAGLAGTAYYGSKIFGAAEGGSVPGYAGGGIASFVEGGGIQSLNPFELEAVADRFSDAQIAQNIKPNNVADLVTMAMKQEQADRGRLRGLAAAAKQQPQPQTTVAEEYAAAKGLPALALADDAVVGGAEGGIVGYAGGTGEEGVQTGSPFSRGLQTYRDEGADYEKAERLFTAVAEKYGPAAGLAGLFREQTDAERKQAQEIMSKADQARAKRDVATLISLLGDGATPQTDPNFRRVSTDAPQAATAATAPQAPALAMPPEPDFEAGDPVYGAVRQEQRAPRAPSQEELDRQAYEKEVAEGRAPESALQRKPGAIPAPPKPTTQFTPEKIADIYGRATKPGIDAMREGLAKQETAAAQYKTELETIEAERKKAVDEAGEYGTAKEARAKERLANIDSRKEDAKLSFIRDVSTTLLTSPTRNFLSDLGVAVGKGGKAYDAKIEQIDAAKEKLQDSIDAIMEQRRGEKIANAKEARDAKAGISKASLDLAKALANSQTEVGKLSLGMAKDIVGASVQNAMSMEGRQYQSELEAYRAQVSAQADARKPVSSDQQRAQVAELLSSSDPAKRHLGRKLLESMERATRASEFGRPVPGQITDSTRLTALQTALEDIRNQVFAGTTPLGREIKALPKAEQEKRIREEAERAATYAIGAAQRLGSGSEPRSGTFASQTGR